MAVTLEDLAAHLGMMGVPPDPAQLERALESATATVRAQLVRDPQGPHEGHVLDQAVLIVAGDLWRRKDAPGGTYGFADGVDYPASLPRDPLAPVRSMLTSVGLFAGAVVA